MTDANTNVENRWADLLHEATTKPGLMAECYDAFHNYSVSNQLLAAWQCRERKIPIGPISTFRGWLAKGRHVRKGEKAIVLCMPRAGRKTVTGKDGQERDEVFHYFVYKPFWFAYAQTDGAEVEPEPLPDWNEATALATLGITLAQFDMADGNCQGWCDTKNGKLALNPMAQHRARTLFHELAHAILHNNPNREDRPTRELEAEATAMLVGDALGLDGDDESRAYIQHWYGTGKTVDAKTAQRIFSTATKILNAGKATVEMAEAA